MEGKYASSHGDISNATSPGKYDLISLRDVKWLLTSQKKKRHGGFTHEILPLFTFNF